MIKKIKELNKKIKNCVYKELYKLTNMDDVFLYGYSHIKKNLWAA